jgi:hypothetical protein
VKTRADFRQHFTRMADDPKSSAWQVRFAKSALRNLGGRHEPRPEPTPPPMARVPLPEEMALDEALADMANP